MSLKDIMNDEYNIMMQQKLQGWQGFQTLDNGVEIIKLEESLYKSQIRKKYDRQNLKSYQNAPFSCYTKNKNLHTPKIIHQLQSITQFNNFQNISLDDPQKLQYIKSIQQYQQIEDYFKTGYRCVYQRFNSQINKTLLYHQLKEYSIDQYKRFIDCESTDQNTKNSECKFIFSSNFQCGNLSKVYEPCVQNVKNITSPFYLLLSSDTNTDGYHQWFFFKVTNNSYQRAKKRFIIAKISKKIISCIHLTGIKCFSLRKYTKYNIGWHNWKHNLSVTLLKNNQKSQFQAIQFQYQFHPFQSVYFSLTLPYTFSRLKNTLMDLNINPKIIGNTIIGNPILSINYNNANSDKVLLILSRQHSCQTSSSFVVEGILRALEQNLLCMKMLKKKYHIIILPMCNPDGVIHGFDINRKWNHKAEKHQSSQIVEILSYLQHYNVQIQYLIDLHGHSKKLNSFGYFSTSRKFATLMAFQLSKKLEWFKISCCTLDKLTQYNKNTLRSMSKNYFNIQKSFTIETSLFGWIDNKNNIHPFTSKQMMITGEAILESIFNIQFKKVNNSQKLIIQLKFSDEKTGSDSDEQRQSLSPSAPLFKNSFNLSQRNKITSSHFRLRQSFKLKTTQNRDSEGKKRERSKTQYRSPSKLDIILTPNIRDKKKSKIMQRYIINQGLKKKSKPKIKLQHICVVSSMENRKIITQQRLLE